MDLNTEQINKLLEMLKDVGGYSQELMTQATNSVLISHLVVSIVTMLALVPVLYIARLIRKHLKQTEDKVLCYFIISMCLFVCVVLISSSIIGIFKCAISPEWVAVRELLNIVK